MKRRKMLDKLQRRQKDYDNSPGIASANRLAPGSFTRPGSMNGRKSAGKKRRDR